MGDAWDPEREQVHRRAFSRIGIGYAVAALLFLALCCYGVWWTGTFLIDTFGLRR